MRWRVAVMLSAAVLRGAPIATSLVFVAGVGSSADYAEIAFLVILAPLTALFGSFGLDQSLYRHLVSGGSTAAVSWTFRFWLGSLFALPLLAVMGLAVGGVLAGAQLNYVFVLVASWAGALPMLSVNALLRASENSIGLFGHSSAIALAYAVPRLIGVSVGGGAGVSWVLGDITAALVAASIFTVVRIRQGQESVRPGGAYRYGLPMATNGVLHWTLGSSDRFVLGASLSASMLGVYGAAYQYAALFNAAATEFNKAGLRHYAPNSPTSVRYRMVRDGLMLLMLWLLCFVPVLALLFYTESKGFDGAMLLGTALYASLVPLVIYLPLANLVTIRLGRAGLLTAATLAGAVVNVLSNLLLVPSLGVWAGPIANGAGFSVMAGVIVSTVYATHISAVRRQPA